MSPRLSRAVSCVKKKKKLKWVYSSSPHYHIPPCFDMWWWCGGGGGGGRSSWREWGCWRDPPPSSPSAAWGMLFFCPLSPMCRRPLGRVCFACKAGCRCCPPKQGTERDKGEAEHREGPTAVPPAWPHFFFLLPLLGSTSHYFSPVSSSKNYTAQEQRKQWRTRIKVFWKCGINFQLLCSRGDTLQVY